MTSVAAMIAATPTDTLHDRCVQLATILADPRVTGTKRATIARKYDQLDAEIARRDRVEAGLPA